MKRFVIGFVIGVGLMYWLLNHGESVEYATRAWFQNAASHYRDDKQHDAARHVLGESEHRR